VHMGKEGVVDTRSLPFISLHVVQVCANHSTLCLQLKMGLKVLRKFFYHKPLPSRLLHMVIFFLVEDVTQSVGCMWHWQD
jgi:hypothetical protein